MSRRRLNRTLLRRQFLAVASAGGAEHAVAHLAGLQAQVPKDPYVSLWSRLAAFTQDDLAGLMTQRRLVRVALMRSTIHLVTAEDVWPLRAAVRQAMERDLFRNATFGKPVEGMDLAALVADARAALREKPMTAAELGQRLQRRWPERDGLAMAYAVRNLEPLIQVPPRGLWGVPGQPRHAAARDWLPPGAQAPPEPASPEAGSLRAMVTRYLAAHGPAAVRDMQAWSGVTRLAEITGPMRDQLRRYADADGRELLDLPEGELAAEDGPAPPRFLPEYDNAVLGYADRSRILPDGVTFTSYWAALRPKSVARGGVLSGGFLRAAWSVRAAAGGSGGHVLHADPLPGESLTGAEEAGIEEEGRRLLGFVLGDAGAREARVEITRPA